MTILAIGPANYAGQAHQWAGAVRAHLTIDAFSFSYRPRPFRVGPRPAFSFPSDRQFPHPRTCTPFGRSIRRRGLGRLPYVMLDGFIPVGEPLDAGIDGDLRYLIRSGTGVAMVSHGSDLRHPDEHRSLFTQSYFDHAQPEWTALMRATVERNQGTLSHFPEVPLFVSTPDLLLHQPRAAWLPLCVGSELFEVPALPLLQRDTPVVLHIPSRRDPPIKGTHLIDPVMQRLQSRGVIDYVSPKAVLHEEMLRLLASADIVIDQTLTGSYGLTAVEAMALGRVVVGHVAASVRAAMPEEPTIVDAAPDGLESAIMAIVDNRAHFTEFANRSRAFARKWHDGRAAASAVAHWLQLDPPPT